MPTKAYKDKNGKKKFYASFYYTDFTGQRKRKKKEGFTSSAAAKQYEKDFIDLHNGNSTIIFKNLVEVYLADCSQRLKPTTVYGKKAVLTTLILPFFENYPIAEISPLIVRKWQNEILKHGYKPTTLRAIHAQLASTLNFGVKYYGLKHNPATLAGSIGTLKPHNKIQFYTLEQFKKFLPCVDEKYKLPFKILFFTGLRIGELLALTIKDFNPKTGTLDINKTLSNIHGIVQPPKTPKSKRIVTLPPFLIHEIEDYIFFKFYEPQPSERLFYWFSFMALRKASNRAAKLAGLPRLRIHDFRHSHASLLINLNFPPLAVSERLGHESVKTTLEIYSHLYPEQASNIAEKLDVFKI